MVLFLKLFVDKILKCLLTIILLMVKLGEGKCSFSGLKPLLRLIAMVLKEGVSIAYLWAARLSERLVFC